MTTAAPVTQADKVDEYLEQLDRQDAVSDVTVSTRGGLPAVSFFSEDENSPTVSSSQMKAVRKRARTMTRINQLAARGYQPQIRSFNELLRGVREIEMPGNTEYARKFQDQFEATKKSILRAVTHGLPPETAEAQMKAIGMNTFEADRGGTLVLPEFSQDIITRDYDFSDLYGRVKQYTVGGNSMTFPKLRDNNRTDGQRAGGVLSMWTGEEEAMSESRPAFDDFTLKLNKLTTVVFVTQEMIEDFFGGALSGYVGDIVRDEMRFKKGNAIFRGTGAKQPLGIINSPGRVTVSKVAGQAANTIDGTNILEMYRRRLANKTSKYLWLINQNIETQLNSMQIGATSNAAAMLQYRPPEGLSAAPYGTLMGLPIIVSEYCSTLGTEGDIVLWCPDEYITISKGGIVEDTSIHVAFLRGQTAYRFVERADGRLCEDAPITPLNSDATAPENDTQSSVITLETRA